MQFIETVVFHPHLAHIADTANETMSFLRLCCLTRLLRLHHHVEA